MKIAFICEFSHPSKCGVWNSVYHVANELKKRGHEIHIFSNNLIKGTSKTSKRQEKVKGITYHRFPITYKLSQNACQWKFKKELIALKPDLIHAHAYRHTYTQKVPKIAKKLKIPCYLTTHAPFLEKGLRSSLLQFAVNLYDSLYSKKVLNSYTKVFPISKWEMPILKKLGLKKSKTILIPNGFPKEFLKIKVKPNKNAIFMGRIAPIKNLETILKSAKELPQVKFTIYGPIENGYKIKSQLKNINIIGQPYDQKEEIKELKKNSIFILPSKREGIPLALTEAMAAGLVCISSNTQGGKELIKHNKNGLLFQINDSDQLTLAIKNALSQKTWKKLSSAGKKAIKERTWEQITKNLENIYKTDKNNPKSF